MVGAGASYLRGGRMSEEAQDIDTLDVILIFAKAWKWLIIIPALAAVLAYAATMFIPVQYTASARLLMLERQALILTSPSITGQLLGHDANFSVAGGGDISTIYTTNENPEAAKSDLERLLDYAASDEFHNKIVASVTSVLSEIGVDRIEMAETAFRLARRPQVISTISVTPSASRTTSITI